MSSADSVAQGAMLLVITFLVGMTVGAVSLAWMRPNPPAPVVAPASVDDDSYRQALRYLELSTKTTEVCLKQLEHIRYFAETTE